MCLLFDGKANRDSSIMEKKMKITILVPTPGNTPIGGVKVLYEYANGFVKHGHQVTMLHTLTDRTKKLGFLKAATVYLGRLLGFKGGYGSKGWMRVDDRINIKFVPDLRACFLPKSDAIIATSWSTAEKAEHFPDSCGEKYYFIQDYEYYMSAEASVKNRMIATYRSRKFKNIVISPACRDMVESAGGTVYAEIPNGIDLQQYHLVNPIEDGTVRNYIGFPTRKEPFKRTEYAIQALERLYDTDASKNMRYWTFGAEKPEGLPDWIEFYQRPTDDKLTELYNRSAIFIVPSEYEGWGLPGSEAMCCGAALVSTDNGGVHAYARNGENAIILDKKEDAALFEAAIYDLVRNEEKRYRLANNAVSSMKQFTWSFAVDKFLRILKSE